MKVIKYEVFHKSAQIQKKVVKKNNYTYANVINTIKPRLSDKKIDILDYGCGVGTLSLYLSSKSNKVLGLDISDKAISTARKSAEKIGINNVKFYTLAEKNLNTIKEKFDLIIMIEVIEHVPNDKVCISEIINHLKRGGYLILTTPSITAPLYKLGLLKEFDERVGHLRRYSISSLNRLFKDLDIKIINIDEKESILRNILYTNTYFGWILRFIKGPISNIFLSLEQPLIKLFGGSNYFVVGFKP